MSRRVAQILFDLDGTLIDSLPGIVRAINHALGDVDQQPMDEARLRPFVGRPLRDIFRELLATTDQKAVERVVEAYRARFEIDGVAGCDAFPGVRPALDALRAEGAVLRIATVKPAGIAARVLERLELDHHFASVHGADPAEHSTDKVAIVGEALAAAGAGVAASAMIGDRAEDIRAARAHGVPAVGVRWGYGGVEELVAAGADAILDTPDRLSAWLAARRVG